MAQVLHPEPGHDFYHRSFIYPLVVYSGLCVFAIASAVFLSILRYRDVKPMDLLNPNLSNKFVFTLVPPVFVIFGFFAMCCLLSTVMEVLRPNRKASRYGYRCSCFGAFMTILIMVALGLPLTTEMSVACTVLYLGLSITHGFRSWQLAKRRAKSRGSQHVLEAYSMR